MKQLLHQIILLLFIFLLPSYAFSKNVALFIAIDDYETSDYGNLKTSVKGAEDIRALLENQYNFTETTILYNKDATKERILETIEDILSTLIETDNFLLFYGGHGIVEETKGYWIPFNVTDTKDVTQLVANEDVRMLISKSKVKHILGIIDGCYQENGFNTSSLVLKNTGNADYYEQVNELASRQVITSGGFSPFESIGDVHSVFVKYILRFLQKNDKAFYDIVQLFDVIKFSVGANSDNMPRLGHLQNTGHEGGQFVFMKNNTSTSETTLINSAKPESNNQEKECNLVVSLREGLAIEFDEKGGTLNAWSSKQNVRFDWLKDGVSLGQNTPILTVKETGKYTVQVEAGANCKEEATINVSILKPESNLLILEGEYTEFTMKGTLRAKSDIENATYVWACNGFEIGRGATLKVFESGTYTVQLYDAAGEKIDIFSTKVKIKDRIYYVNKSEEKISDIAQRYYGSGAKGKLIIAANQKILKGKSVAKKGMSLIIPNDKINGLMPVKLNIIGASAFAPFSGVELHERGMITNFIDVITNEMKLDAKIEFLNWSEANEGVIQGKYAASFPMLKTTKLAEEALFSEPLYNILNVVFTKKGAGIDITKPNKLNGKVVAIQEGYQVGKLRAFQEKGYVKLRPCGSLKACFLLLERGEVDMVVTTQMAGWGLLETSEAFQSANFEMLNQTLETSTLHLAISKKMLGAEFLIAQFNETFRRLKNSGKIDELRDIHIDLFQQKLDKP